MAIHAFTRVSYRRGMDEISDNTPGTLGARAVAGIRSALGTLAASERRVAEVVLSDPKSVISMTASQLGEKAQTSATTVIRFARSVGYTGFQELAITLAVAEPTIESLPTLSPTDTPDQTLASVSAIGAHTVAGVRSAVDPEEFAATVAALTGANRILAVGASLSHPVALDFSYRLDHLGLPAEAPADAQIQRIRAGSLRPGDACVIFLHGGTYPHGLEVAREAQAAGATVVAVTSFVRTPLVQLADHALVVGASTARSGLDAWASRLAFLTVVDALVAAISNTDPERYARGLEHISDLIERGSM